MKNLGDKIASVAQPIAKGFDWAFGSNVAGCSGCKQMQSNLNAGMPLHTALYDRFFNSVNKNAASKQTTEGITQMQFVITKQIAIEAETPEEAMAKIAEGQTIAISVNARPQPPQPRPPQAH